MADGPLKKVAKKKPDLSLEKVGRRRAAVAVDEDLEREDTLEIQAFRKVLLKGGEFRGARGLKGEIGETGDTGRRGRRGLRGDTGERGELGLTGEAVVGPAGVHGVDGVPGEHGRQGDAGRTGPKGDKGDTGPPPRHKWEGTELSFEQPNGRFGRKVNLQGPAGGRGASGGRSANPGFSSISLVGTDLVFARDPAGPLGPDITVDLSGLNAGGGFAGLGPWRYRTATTPNPSSGRVQFNNADPELATELYLNETNDNGDDLANFLALLVAGDILYIQDASDASSFIVVQISSNTDNGPDVTFGIAAVEQQGAALTQNTSVIIIATAPGIAGGGGVKTKDVTIQLPIPTDNIRYFFTDKQITIVKLVYVLQGIVTSDADVLISFGPDRSVLATDLITGGTTVSNQTTGQVITNFDNPVIPANSHIAIDVTAITDAPDELAATLFYL